MEAAMQARENERRDWIIILVIILLGFLCVIVAGQWAVRFSPRWKLDTNMGSKLNPNSDFLTNIPISNIAPVDPAILTPPSWLASFLTPGATFNTNTPIPTKTNTATATATMPVIQTNTPTSTSTATSTLVAYVTATLKPPATKTSAPGNTSTPTPTVTPAYTSTPTNIPSSTTATNTPTATSTSTPTNTPTDIPTSTPTDTPTNTPTDTPTATPSNTPPPQADLAITVNDGVVVYEANDTLVYTVLVSNSGPTNITGATVNSTRPAQIASWNWVCTAQTNASGCAGSNTSPFTNTLDIQSGGSIEYTVTAQVSSNPSGNLVTSATITSAVSDPNAVNNSSTDTDELATGFPSDLESGATPGGPPYQGISDGGILTLVLPKSITVDGNMDVDLIYYEEASIPAGNISMDWITLQIGNGSNWYTVLNWGDGIPDANTNISIPLAGNSGGPCVDELDNCPIDSTLLYFNTGITINVDIGSIPAGTYPYLRIIASMGSTGPTDGGVRVDGIYVP